MKNEFTHIRSALWMAAIILGLSFLLKKMSAAGLIHGGISDRLAQVVIGLAVVWSGNVIPKQLQRSSESCEPARRHSQRRFAGWTLVLAGIAYSVIWLAAPLESAWIISISVLGGALLLVVSSCVWTSLRRRTAGL